MPLRRSAKAPATQGLPVTGRFEVMRTLHPGADLLQRFEYLRILRLEFSIHGHIFGGVFTKKDQRVSDVIGLIDGRGDLFHHLRFCLRANPRRSFYEYDWHSSPTSNQFVVVWQP